ncbi:SHOCT domain-containing protein [Streptomyces sp. NPDC092296]|uniref:SHOCT domain-containing protein n=1 Tax=Streptomyces sp. NPDC092296 TaxID=3366012 RepID=UPI003814D941
MSDNANRAGYSAGRTAHRVERRPSAQQAADPISDKIDRLKEISDLRDQGALTDAEFEARKSRILAS